MNKYKLKIDTTSYNSKPTGKEIGTINCRLVKQENKDYTLQEISHALSHGHTIVPAVVEGERKKQNWKQQQIFLVDIDNAEKNKSRLSDNDYLTPAQAMNICKQNNIKPFLIYHTFSSKPNFLKFRLCFAMNKVITDLSEQFKIISNLINLFGRAADAVCTGGERLYFGGCPNDNNISDFNAINDINIILNLKQQEQEQEQTRTSFSIQYNENKNNWSKEFDLSADELLYCLDPDSDYTTWFEYTMAYKAAGGDRETWLDWCKQSTKFKSNDSKKWNTKPQCTGIGQLKKYAFQTDAGQKILNFALMEQAKAKDEYKHHLPKHTHIKTSENLEEIPWNSFTFSDAGNAQRFLYIADGKFLYNYDQKRWMWYNGKHWNIDKINAVKQCVDEMRYFMYTTEKKYWLQHVEDINENGDNIYKISQKHRQKTLNNAYVRNLLEEAQHHVPALEEYFDINKYELNTQNYLVNLKTEQACSHNKSQMVTKLFNCEYHTKYTQPCGKFIKYLDTAFCGNKDLIKYIQKLLGYCLTGDTSDQGIYILYGEGQNGKSVFLELIKYLWADYATTIPIDSLLRSSFQSSGSQATPDLMKLKGARLVTTVEPNESVHLDEAKIKQLTGGDSVTARALHSDFITFTPECKIFIASNHKLQISGTDYGIWRRIHLIPFTVKIPTEQVNKNLLNELKEEKNGIFRWILEGLKLYQQEGLKEPEIMATEKALYRKEMNIIETFLSECEELEENQSKQIKAAELYSLFKNWCAENGRHAYSSTKFGTEITKKFKKIHNMYGWYYIGIGYTSNSKIYDNPYT